MKKPIPFELEEGQIHIEVEETEQGAQWVDARESDDTAAARWIKKDPDAAE